MQGHFIRIIEKKRMECKYKTLIFSMSGLAANSAWQKKETSLCRYTWLYKTIMTLFSKTEYKYLVVK